MRKPGPEGRFYKGVAIAIPISIALWWAIIELVRWLS